MWKFIPLAHLTFTVFVVTFSMIKFVYVSLENYAFLSILLRRAKKFKVTQLGGGRASNRFWCFICYILISFPPLVLLVTSFYLVRVIWPDLESGSCHGLSAYCELGPWQTWRGRYDQTQFTFVNANKTEVGTWVFNFLLCQATAEWKKYICLHFDCLWDPK